MIRAHKLGFALIISFLSFATATAQESKPAKTGTYRNVQPLGTSDAKWTDGFWKQRFDACRDKMVPSMWELMKGTKYKPFLEHFRIAAGLSKGGYHGAKWNDGDFYKWMEAVCALIAVEPDTVWDQRLDEIIQIIGKAQRADGYIHTPVLVAARNGNANAKPFADRFNFEMYNMGHLMTTACLHHQVTGKTEFLVIARKAADFLDNEFHEPTPEQARHAICPSHYMGILDLYRVTGEPRYLQLAQRLIGMRDIVTNGGDDNQDLVPFTQQTEAVGHAVRATYLYAGVADLYAETGDQQLTHTLELIWKNLVGKKMYVTGGCGALHDGASPYGSKNQRTITRVHQAFGYNYQLPNATAHNETCANIGNVLFNWRMFLATGEAKYIDVLELSLYNSVLSGVSLNGKDFFYTNPLRQENVAPVELRWARTRVPFVTSFCCPPNVVRTVARTGEYAYAISDKTIWVNLYGSNELDTTLSNGKRIRLTQQTQYPWDGTVTLRVHETNEAAVQLKLRIPGWAKNAELLVDGVPSDVKPAPGTYVTLPQVSVGQQIELQLPMPPQILESHPLVEETRNHLAVKRGPIVYCLESQDLPEGTSLSDVRVPADVKLTPRYDAESLDGIVRLEGRVTARSAVPWRDELYREFQQPTATPIPVSLIPYYVWANRGPSEMTVWLPLD